MTVESGARSGVRPGARSAPSPEEPAAPDEAGLQAYVDVVRRRRSIRSLKTGPVADAVIDGILEAGRWSPSARNSQPTRIVVVRERQEEFWDFVAKELRDKPQTPPLQGAVSRIPGFRSGVFTLVFYEAVQPAAVLPPIPGMAEMVRKFTAQALGIAQANVWNAIAAAGLAASKQHFTNQIEDELRDFLGVPDTWKSVSVFPVGYADETPEEGSRNAPEAIVFHEHGPETQVKE